MTTVPDAPAPPPGARPHAPLLIEAKVRIPPLRDEVFERTAVHRALDEASRRALTVIIAPAGYAKTTSLATWARGRAGVAWVTLDARDSEATRLLAHVITAVERVVLAVGEAAWPALLLGSDPVEVVVPLIANALHARPDGEVLLVLDDHHLMQDSAGGPILRALADAAPPALRILLSSRRPPPWPLARLRAAGRLAEIGPDELRMSRAEVGMLVNDRFGLELSPLQTAQLSDATEGWPAAVSLAALRGASGSQAFALKQTAPVEIVEYLVQEVLDAAGDRMRAFLRQTSILSFLHADLCCAVLDDPHAADLLAEARRANMLITPVDDLGEWLRYHQLFADLLRSELLRWEEPAHVATLHRPGRHLAGRGRSARGGDRARDRGWRRAVGGAAAQRGLARSRAGAAL